MTFPPARPAGVAITGTGIALPEKVLSNHDLAKIVETSDDWIYQRTKMRERRTAAADQTVVTLGRDAVAAALQNANLSPKDLDFLVCASITSQTPCPASATRIVDELGATPAGGADVVAACSGFVYGLNMASALVQTGHYQHVAVVGAETLTHALNWQDRTTCVLFGDGAGAAIVSASPNEQQTCLYQSMSSDGSGWKDLYIPPSPDYVPEGDTVYNGQPGSLQMNGREVYKFAVKTIMATIRDALKKTGMTLDDLDMIVTHQSNGRIIESAREKLGLPEGKIHVNIERYANTSAASVPISLHELVSEGKLTPGSGQHVLFIAMGAGLTWANSLWRI